MTCYGCNLYDVLLLVADGRFCCSLFVASFFLYVLRSVLRFLFVVCCVRVVVVVRCLLFVVCVVRWLLLAAVSCWLFVVGCSLVFVVCCLLFDD